MAGDSKAKVIPLHSNSSRAAAARRASQRAEAARRHPSLMADPGSRASAEDIEAVVREIREESGFEAKVLKLAAIWDRSKHPHRPFMPFHIYKLFFLCEITGGAPAESHETTGVGFFGEDEIPQELSISRTLPFQLARMFTHYRNPALPTDFD